MDEIYPPKWFSATKNADFKKYFDEFRSCIDEPIKVGRKKIDNQRFITGEILGLDISPSTFEELSEATSTDLLICDGENIDEYPMETPDYTKAILPKLFKEELSKDLNVVKCRDFLERNAPNMIRNRTMRKTFLKSLEFSDVPVDFNEDLKPGCDFVLTVTVHKPVLFSYSSKKNASEKLRWNHEILILGRNTLTELRDRIYCEIDEGLYKEVDDTKVDLAPLLNAKEIYPSGFLFINDVFYNDFRSPKSIDYSSPIMKWAQSKIEGLTAKSMSNVTIESLRPKLGYPYLYMHQGNCEHVIVFSDARLLNHGDNMYSISYPHIIRSNMSNNNMCFLCVVSFSKWIVVDSDRVPQEKVFLCTECCNSYLYKDGKKLGDFKLYPYYGKHILDNYNSF